MKTAVLIICKNNNLNTSDNKMNLLAQLATRLNHALQNAKVASGRLFLNFLLRTHTSQHPVNLNNR